MARPLLLASSMHTILPSKPKTTPFFVLLSIFSIFSVITFLCGTRKMKKFKAKALESATSKKNKLITKINSNLSNNRAVSSMAKMLSWRKVQAAEEEEEQEIFFSSDDHDQYHQDDEAIWKKNILMGERCRPVDFSGKIVYDEHGNLVRDLSRD